MSGLAHDAGHDPEVRFVLRIMKNLFRREFKLHPAFGDVAKLPAYPMEIFHRIFRQQTVYLVLVEVSVWFRGDAQYLPQRLVKFGCQGCLRLSSIFWCGMLSDGCLMDYKLFTNNRDD